MPLPILQTAFAGPALIGRRPVTAVAVLSLNVLYLFGVIGLSTTLGGAGPEMAAFQQGGGERLSGNLAPFGLSLLLFLLMLAASAALILQAQGLGGRGSPLAVAGAVLRQLAVTLLLAVAQSVLLLLGLTLAALVSGLSGRGQTVTGPAMAIYFVCMLGVLAVMGLLAGKLALVGPLSSTEGRLRLISAIRLTTGLTRRLTVLFGLLMLVSAILLFVLYVPIALITPAALPIFTASPHELTPTGILALVLKGAAGAVLTLLWLAPGGAILQALRNSAPARQAEVFA